MGQGKFLTYNRSARGLQRHTIVMWDSDPMGRYLISENLAVKDLPQRKHLRHILK